MNKQLLFLMLLCVAFLSAQTKEVTYRKDSGKPINKERKATIQKSSTARQSSIIFSEDFSGSSLPTGWTILDNDDDGYTWAIDSIQGRAYSASYNDLALTPDNWLVTPSVMLPTGSSIILEYDIQAYNPYFDSENYAVYVKTNGNYSPALFEETLANGDLFHRTLDLSVYAGQSVNIGIRHYNRTELNNLLLDNFTIHATSDSSIVLADTINFSCLINNYIEEEVNFFNTSITDSIIISATSPFEVSSDNSTYGRSIKVLPSTQSNFYVRIYSSSAGNVNGTLSLVGGSINQTLILNSRFFTCGQSLTAPYIETFDNRDYHLFCWDMLDMNNDERRFFTLEEEGPTGLEVIGFMYEYSADNAANDYLISPQFHINASDNLLLRSHVSNSNYPERFSIYGIDPNYANATDIESNKILLAGPFDLTNENDTTISVPLSSYAGRDLRFAIHCHSDANMFNFIVDGFELRNSNINVDTKPILKNEQVLYPNPVCDVLYFTEAAERVMVYTTSGQLLYQGSLNETEQSVNVSFLPQGLYMVRLMSKESVSTHLIIKE